MRAIAPRGGDLRAQRIFRERRAGLRRDLRAAGDQQPGRARRVGPFRRRPPAGAGSAALHVDTGMNRLGLTHRGGARRSRAHIRSENHHIALLMSHLACADTAGASAERSADPAVSRNPLAVSRHLQFARQLVRHLPRRVDLLRHGAPRRRALWRQSDAGQAQSDAAGDRAARRTSCRCATSPRARRSATARAWTARRDSRIAVIAAGYADGICARLGHHRRPAAARGAGRRQALPDRRAHLDGPDGAGRHRLAGERGAPRPDGHPDRRRLEPRRGGRRQAGTISYEVLTNLGRRYHRVWKS